MELSVVIVLYVRLFCS